MTNFIARMAKSQMENRGDNKEIKNMADREKVIKGLEELHGSQETMELISDTIALLKEQEAVLPRKIDGKRNHFIKCGNCNANLLSGMKFCCQCGKAVKWD